MFITIKNPALLRIYLTTLFSMFITTAQGTISILYALELGANILQINLITNISGTMAIFLEIPFGILSDRLGRKRMLLYSNILLIMGSVLRIFATEPNLLIFAAMFGGASGEFFPIMQSMIADITERNANSRQEAMSIMFLFSSIGMLLAPIVTSFILTLPQLGLRNICQIILMLQAAFIIYVTIQLSETKPKVSESSRDSYRLHVVDLLRRKSFQAIIVVGALNWFFRQTLLTYVKIYAKVDLNLSNAEVASVDIFSNLATFIIRLLSATLLTRIPFRPTIISFMVLGGATGLVSIFADSYLFIALIFFLQGISYGATRTMQNVLVANVTSPENRGVANSINQLFMSTATFTNILTTPIVDALGFPSMFILAGIAALVAAVPPLVRKDDFKL